MRLVTIDPKEYNKEIDRFNTSVIALQKIFTKEYASKFTKELENKINKITVYTNRALIGGGYYGDTNVENGRFEIRYGSTSDIRQNIFITLHELTHVIITPINKSEVKELSNIISSQGITKLDKKENEFYGISLTESFCNIIAKISIINRQHENVDNYMNNGLHNYVYNYYEPFEDITRLLIIASITDYFGSYTFDEIISTEGINAIINNQPYSIFINSALNNDFEMEKEFDNFTSKGEFRSMCEVLDKEMLKLDIDDDIINPSYDKDILDSVLIKIESYYFNKIEYLFRKGIISSMEMKERKLNKFQNIIDSVRSKFNVL